MRFKIFYPVIKELIKSNQYKNALILFFNLNLLVYSLTFNTFNMFHLKAICFQFYDPPCCLIKYDTKIDLNCNPGKRALLKQGINLNMQHGKGIT